MTRPVAKLREVRLGTESYQYRTPIKFGGQTLDRVTILNAWVSLEVLGKTHIGFGSMPLGNVWAWPSRSLSYHETLAAMQDVARHFALDWPALAPVGHPIEILTATESRVFDLAADYQEATRQPERMPDLAALVAIAPLDAALHDGYAKALGRSAYDILGPEFLAGDVSRFLGPEFAGVNWSVAVRNRPVPRLPLYHLVGALDPLTPAEVQHPVGDGRPETLIDWIQTDGLTHLKIKLNGDAHQWDYDRIAAVHAVACRTRPGVRFHYSLDFNERCPDVDALLLLLERLRREQPLAYDWVEYVEQPTSRSQSGYSLHEAARLKPMVVDEGLLHLDSLRAQRDRGYNGVAFKACKGQTNSLLLAVAAAHWGLFRCVQDLTCPGASLIHSAGLAAHLVGVQAIEANARQYVPVANESWLSRHPGCFLVRDGQLQTETLIGPGLSATPVDLS